VRAKTVNFERGMDPRDSMGIGDPDARKFMEAFRDKDYFAPVLESMLNGLKKGSIKEENAVRFTHGAVLKAEAKQRFAWYEWFKESGLMFWSPKSKEFIITFDLPDIDFLDLTKYRKIRCKISTGTIGYGIESFLQVQTSGEEFVEEIFHHDNIFMGSDPIFTLAFVLKSISTVVETTIKNMD